VLGGGGTDPGATRAKIGPRAPRDPCYGHAPEICLHSWREAETPEPVHGRTRSGRAVTEQLVSELAADAEAGFDVAATVRRRRGRPPIGSAAAQVESVRLDPELLEALVNRAHDDGESTSAVIRKALRQFLKA